MEAKIRLHYIILHHIKKRRDKMNIKFLKDEVEQWISNYFDDKPEIDNRNFEAMIYSIKVGGKRVRPILMLLTYAMYKDDYRDILPFAAALEMIHTYSLIHDDLPCMDDDDLRRGKPTNHKIYGEAIAILAGDGLLNEAMNILFDFSLAHGQGALKASREIAYSSGAHGMIGGQVVDIINEGKQNISIEELKYMHMKKTGELIRASIVSGALLANAPEEEISLLETFGYKLGLAFQIKDDILDVVGCTEKLGKTINSDIEGNKTNYITLFGLEKSMEMCEKLTTECIEILNSIDGNTEELKKLTVHLLRREN